MPQENKPLSEPSDVELVAESIIAAVASLLSIIPPIGAVAAASLSIWQTQNYKKLVHIVSQKFKRIDQEKLDKQFLQSDEFKELAIQVVEAGIRSASEKKHEALANALLSAVVTPTHTFNNKLTIFRVIASMSNEEMLVLKALYDYEIKVLSNPEKYAQPKKVTEGPFITIEEVSKSLNQSEDRVLVTLDGLQQLGLAYDWVQSYAGMDNRRNFWRITNLGYRSCQYVHQEHTE